MTKVAVATSALLILLPLTTLADESQFLYVWAADQDYRDSDFLAVIDANVESASYGNVLRTVPVGKAVHAHHTEHRMPDDSQLFVNGFYFGETYIVDLSDPLKPELKTSFTDRGQFSYPHSFERLPNGNVLATFQTGRVNRRPMADLEGRPFLSVMPMFRASRGDTFTTGGLVELTPKGELVRSQSGAIPEFPEILPYSLAIVAEADRVVTTTSDMWGERQADSIQIWRLSDLSVLHTLRLPPGPRGDENKRPAEARVLADGETVLVNTFSCGLYEVRDLASPSPSIRHIDTLVAEMIDASGMSCALPVTLGNFWVNTVPQRNGLVAYDVRDTANVKEVGYVDLGQGLLPHWISLEPDHERIVVTGYGPRMNEVVMVRIDQETGALVIDAEFGHEGKITFERGDWPHGPTGPAVPHGAVFSIR